MFGRYYELERRTQDGMLCFRIVRRAECITHRVIDEYAAGRFDLCNQVTAGCHTHRCDGVFFDDAADQTHGLVVERSGGYRNKNVDAVLVQRGREGGR